MYYYQCLWATFLPWSIKFYNSWIISKSMLPKSSIQCLVTSETTGSSRTLMLILFGQITCPSGLTYTTWTSRLNPLIGKCRYEHQWPWMSICHILLSKTNQNGMNMQSRPNRATLHITPGFRYCWACNCIRLQRQKSVFLIIDSINHRYGTPSSLRWDLILLPIALAL